MRATSGVQKNPPSVFMEGGLRRDVKSEPDQKSNVSETFIRRGAITDLGASHVPYAKLAPVTVDLLNRL